MAKAQQEVAVAAGGFRSRLKLLLFVAFVVLLLTVGLVVGLVAVPNLSSKHHPPASSSPEAPNVTLSYAVIGENFPDPSVVVVYNHTFHAFATRNEVVNVQVAVGANISSWQYLDGFDALPQPGAWVAKNVDDKQVWAPYVTSMFRGPWVMYYSALSLNDTRKHCIGAAISPNVTGPYTALPTPIVCDFDAGGVIDPSFFQDPMTNTSYLTYKQDGNAIGVGGACSNGNWPNTPTPLMAVQLNDTDLVTPVGKPFVLLENIESDGANIEAPLMYYYEYTATDGANIPSYHLMYNSGCYAHTDYRIQHINCVPAPSTGVKDCAWGATRETGIFAKTLLQTGDFEGKLLAPGGAAIIASQQGGVGSGNYAKEWLIFHADADAAWFANNSRERTRSMFVAELEYGGEEDMVSVKGLIERDGLVVG